MKRGGLLLPLLLACTPSRPAGVADVPLPFNAGPGVIDVSSRLQKIRKERRVPALAAAAFDSQRLLAIGAVGERKAASGTRVTIDDDWHLGSNTKPMTATLYARLVDRGVVRWESPITELFSDQAIHADWRTVTMDKLLSHHGGAPGSLTADTPNLWRHMVTHRDESLPERSWVVNELLRSAPPESVGSFEYSNAGYMMVGNALERRTKQTWEELMTHELFEPLGIEGCGFGAAGECQDGAACNRPTQPLGHRPVGEDRYEPIPPGPSADNPKSLGPAGTVHCDLRSWGRFLQEHLRAARGEPTIVAKPETLQRMTIDAGDKHGLGWALGERRWANGRVLYLQGSNTLNYSNVWIAPKLNRIYIAVTNGGSHDDFIASDDAIGALIDALER